MKISNKLASMLAIIPLLYLTISLVLITPVNAFPTVLIGATNQTYPWDSNPTAEAGSAGIGTITNPGKGRDGDLETYTQLVVAANTALQTFTYSAFDKPILANQFAIGWVDIHVSYLADQTTNDKYGITFQVGASAIQTLQADVSGAAAKFDPANGLQAHRVWGKVADPLAPGIWNWNDIGNTKIIIRTQQVSPPDIKKIRIYEAWLTVYPKPLFPGTSAAVAVSVQPGNITGLSAGETVFIEPYASAPAKAWGYQYILDFDSRILSPNFEYFSNHPFNTQGPSEISDTVFLPVESFFDIFTDVSPYQTLPVNGFLDDNPTGWTRYGDPPYLSGIDQPTNYIETSTTDDWIGNFTFSSLATPLPTTPTQVFVEINTAQTALIEGDDAIEAFVWDEGGSAWVSLGTVLPTPDTFDWKYFPTDAGTVLNTIGKIDNAQVRLYKRTNNVDSDLVQVDAMRLAVGDWHRVGKDPWIDKLDWVGGGGGGGIKTTLDGAKIGYFTFRDLFTRMYGTQVYFEMTAWGDGDDQVELWLYLGGASYVLADTITPATDGSPVTGSADLGPILSTMGKINGAQVYLVKKTVGTAGEIIVDQLGLRIPETGYVSLSYNSYFGDPTGTGAASSFPMGRVYFTVDNDGATLLDLALSVLSDTNGVKIVNTPYRGWFSTSGEEPVPEFPLGLTAIVLFAPLISIIYVWRLRKNKSKGLRQ